MSCHTPPPKFQGVRGRQNTEIKLVREIITTVERFVTGKIETA